jgi:hypothetical protein
MIRHFSIPASNPLNVSKVLCELFDGVLTGFSPYQNSYIVWFGDVNGSAIEVYPKGTEMFPDRGNGQANFRHNPNVTGFAATHAAISIVCNKQNIFEIGQRESWRTIELPRGGFHVIEFWIENQIMLELMTPEMTEHYLKYTHLYLKN